MKSMKTGFSKETERRWVVLESVFTQPIVMTDSGEIVSDLYLPVKS